MTPPTLRYLLISFFAILALTSLVNGEWDDFPEAPSALATLPPDCTDPKHPNRLECWIWQLEVKIPPQTFKDWVTINVHNMICTHFKLEMLQSKQSQSSIDVTVGTVSATCHGRYHSTGGLSGDVKASVSVQPGHDHAIDVSFQVQPSSSTPQQPKALETKTCSTHLEAKSIHFSGSFSAKLIQAFSKTIGHYITQALQEYLCPLLHSQLDPLVTKYLKQFDDLIQPYLLPPNKTQHQTTLSLARRQLSLPSNSSNTTTNSDPSHWKMVHWGLQFLNDQLAKHLQHGWFFSEDGCSKDCANMFRGLSGWLVSIFGETIHLPHQSLPKYFHNISIPSLPYNSKAYISVRSFSVKGLDQLDTVQILAPTIKNNGDKVLASTLSTQQGFQIRIPLLLEIQLEDQILAEDFELAVNITQLETMVESVLQVVDWETTSVLQVVDAVQKIVDTKDWKHLDCLIRTLDQAKLTDWITTVLLDSIRLSRKPTTTTSLSSSLEQDLDQVINSVLELATSQYSELWTSLMQGLTQGPGRRAVNRFVKDWISNHGRHECPPLPTNNLPQWLNFTRFHLLKQMNVFFNHTHTRRTMNNYLECVGSLLEALVGTHNITSNSRETDNTNIVISNIETKHWDTLQTFQVLEPTDATSLESSLKWGDATKGLPQITVTLELIGPQLNGTLRLTAFATLEAAMGTRLDYNLNALKNLTVAHLLEEGQCAMIPAVEFRILPDSILAVGETMGLNISGVLNQQTIQLSSLEYDAVPDAVADILDWSVDWVRHLTNEALEQWVVRSADTCPGVAPDNNSHDDDGGFSWIHHPLILILIVMVVAGQYGLVLLAKPQQYEEPEKLELNKTHELREPLLEDHINEIISPSMLGGDAVDQSLLNDMRDMDKSLLSDIRDQLEDERHQCILEEQHQDTEIQVPKSLLGTNEIPEIIRYAIPVMIVGVIVLLFSSNVSIGASVDLSLTLGQNTIQLPGLFEFSLGNTVAELYKAGIYPLLFLVVVFSGIWPYAKLLLMLRAWLKTYGNVHRREELLITLDALGKFSLVDTYVLVVMLVAFRFHLDVADNLRLQVYVNPEYGFYTFLLATCLSLLLGHGMLYFHRRAQHTETRTCTTQESVFDHDFEVGPRRRLSRIFQVFLLSCCLVAVVLLILGFTKQSFTFEFGGLAGMALGDNKKATYSLLSLGAAISRSVENPKSFGILFLQIAYYFYAVVTPVSCLFFLIALLLYPMTLSKQRSLLVAAEIANAWSAVEVFVLSIVAALFQISTFASFIIGDKCDLINRLVEDFMGKDIIPNGEAPVCFTVQASVESDCWYLVAGVLLNSFVVSLGLRFAHTTFDERLSRSTAGASLVISGDDNLDWSFAKRAFHLPVGWMLFSSDGVDAASAGNEEEEEEESHDWRHWF